MLAVRAARKFSAAVGSGGGGGQWRGALWSRLMNEIRRFYRSMTGPWDHPLRPVGQSTRARVGAGAMDGGSIDRPVPLNSPARARALYNTANHARDSSRYLLRQCASRTTDAMLGVGRCPLIEANGIRPRRCRPCLFLDSVARPLPCYLWIVDVPSLMRARPPRRPPVAAEVRRVTR